MMKLLLMRGCCKPHTRELKRGATAVQLCRPEEPGRGRRYAGDSRSRSCECCCPCPSEPVRRASPSWRRWRRCGRWWSSRRQARRQELRGLKSWAWGPPGLGPLTSNTRTKKPSAGRIGSAPAPTGSALEELLYLVEPAFGARVVARAVLLAKRLELAQELALARGELYRRLDHHVAEEVARHLAAHALDALAAHAERLARLRLGGHADLRRAVERRNRDLAAQRGRRDRDRRLAMQVVRVAREHRMRLDVDLHVE